MGPKPSAPCGRRSEAERRELQGAPPAVRLCRLPGSMKRGGTSETERSACATIPFPGLKSPNVPISRSDLEKRSQGAKRYLTVGYRVARFLRVSKKQRKGQEAPPVLAGRQLSVLSCSVFKARQAFGECAGRRRLARLQPASIHLHSLHQRLAQLRRVAVQPRAAHQYQCVHRASLPFESGSFAGLPCFVLPIHARKNSTVRVCFALMARFDQKSRL